MSPICFLRANSCRMELETFTTGDAHELNGLFSAERQILEAIPKKPISGSSQEPRKGLRENLACSRVEMGPI
jgi:hypothetical protein